MNRIKQLRESKRLTQVELGQATHISHSAIGMYETGQRIPTEKNKQILAEYFNVGVAYLMGYINDEVEAYRKSVDNSRK